MSDDNIHEPFDAGDPVSVKQRRKDIGLAAREHGAALASFMASRAGRTWMYGVLVQCHIFSTSFHSNAMSMAFSEGERNIGLRLVADIQAHCPSRYAKMMQVANDVGSRTDTRPRRNAGLGSDSLLGDPIADSNVEDNAA